LREEGAYRTAWERVLPPASDPKRETRALNFYNCLERSSAVKMVVDYFRDGDVRSQTVETSDLKFKPVVPQTIGEASFEVACTRQAASK
jgi:hypothetical protein